jgi:hypothetical protein
VPKIITAFLFTLTLAVLLCAYVYVVYDSVDIFLTLVVLSYVYVYVAHDTFGTFHDFYEPSIANICSTTIRNIQVHIKLLSYNWIVLDM